MTCSYVELLGAIAFVGWVVGSLGFSLTLVSQFFDSSVASDRQLRYGVSLIGLGLLIIGFTITAYRLC